MTVAGDIVYVPSKTDGLWALDRASTDRCFRFDPEGTVTTPAHPVGGRLVVGISDGVVSGLKPVWRHQLDGG